MLMRLPAAALLCLLALTPAAAMAQEEGGQGTIAIDPSKLGDDTAYQQALSQLTPEQQEQLKNMDTEDAKEVEPDLQVLNMAAKLNYCFQSGKIGAADKKQYATDFISFQQMAAAAKQPLTEAHAAARMQVTFMDQNLLAEHADYHAKLLLTLAGQVMQSAEKKGSFQSTDCEDVKQKLDAVTAGADGAQ